MIIDITGIPITPGNLGADCLGNGLHKGVECSCDECDYMMCCTENHNPEECLNCKDKDCPRSALSGNCSGGIPADK